MNLEIRVAIVMGSTSDLPIMQEACAFLEELGILFETTIVSAHRTPDRLMDFAAKAHNNGIKVIIAGAGGAAHLPGMIAAISPLPVIGVPIKSTQSIDGWDSILSILQMPNGVPVATMALNGAKNAGILAAQILAVEDQTILQKIINHKKSLNDAVLDSAKDLEEFGYKRFLKKQE